MIKNTDLIQLANLLRSLHDRKYRFTTITPSSHQIVNSRPENGWAEDLCGVFGWNRPFKADITGNEVFDLMMSAKVLDPVDKGWKSKIRVSSIGATLFAHSSFPTKDHDAVFFGPDTYRFIKELYLTLSMIDSPIKNCVDIGTGSGVGAILTAAALPGCEVLGVDINQHALDIARANTAAANCKNVSFKYSNLLDQAEGNFDLIISNPPYLVDATKRTYRHGGGLLGAQLSLDIVDVAIKRLSAGGTLFLYTGVAIINGENPFLEEIKKKVINAGFTYDLIEIDPDIFGEELSTEIYSNADRIAAIRLLITKPKLNDDLEHIVAASQHILKSETDIEKL